jgi:hypothetical protein
MRGGIREGVESNSCYILCTDERDFAISAGGENRVFVLDCFEMALTWGRKVFCSPVSDA